MLARRLLVLLFLALEGSFAAVETMVEDVDDDVQIQEQADHDGTTPTPNSSESKRVWGAADSAEMHRGEASSRGAEADEADRRVAATTERKNLDGEDGEESRDDGSRETKGVWGGTSSEIHASKSPEETPTSMNREENDEELADSKESKRVWGTATSEADGPVDERIITQDGDARETAIADKRTKNAKVVADPTATVEENATDSKRMWGAAGDQSSSSPITPKGQTASPPSVAEDTLSHTIPFVATKHLHNHHNHVPPEGYSLAARVYIDSKDKLAHFDYSTENQRISLPYWDCGASGSTTSPLALKNAYFRHSLAAPTSWSSSETGDGMHPVLVVALTPFIMELNSGESLEFDVGDVILLEDCLRPGHRMKPLHSTGPNGNNLKALFLSLPQQHNHAGKQYFSLKKAVTQKQHPCTDMRSERHAEGVDDDSFPEAVASKSGPNLPGLVQKKQPFMPDFWDTHRIRVFLLGTVGLSLSTLAADFLGKTAPLWLAVGVGGTCFVAGCTYGLTVAGDYGLTQLELWLERRRLEPNKKERKE